MKTRNSLIVLISFLVIVIHAKADPIDPGKSIFTSRCAGCHNVNKQLTGPALAGVHERRSIDSEFCSFISNDG
jgi:cytochrome c2